MKLSESNRGKLLTIVLYSFRAPFPLTAALVDTLLNHERSPKLHLLQEEGKTKVSDKMPFVRSLATRVDALERGPRSRDSTYVPERLALHELFFAFPSLEDLSVSINRLWGGCVVDMSPPSTQIHNLKLSDNETFPPLRNLSLSGYKIESEEQVWRDKFPWQGLRSLSLGVQDNPGFLELATGRVHGLSEFKITSYGSSDATEDTGLNNFVSSFHTLESLTAKGTVPSLDAVAHHPNLRHLCLHAIENPNVQRKVLDAKQIGHLNQLYPDLTSLQIDLDPDGAWVSTDDTVSATSTDSFFF
jgi:hypothetical protein